jgi:N-acetylneuraminic acid mutarotase
MDGRIIVAGGEVGHGDWIDDVYAYDPTTNAWAELTSLPGPRFSGVAGVIDGAIYFTTGSSQTTTWRGVFVG